MRSFIGRLALGISLAAFVGSCGGSAAKPAAQKLDQAGAEAVLAGINQQFAAAVAARDTDKVVSFYADDGHVLASNAPRADGHEGIRAVWAQFLSTPGLDLNISSNQVIVSEAGDLLIDLGAYRMKMKGPKGPIEDVGKYVTIFRKTGEDWKIIVDTFNSDTPLPGA